MLKNLPMFRRLIKILCYNCKTVWLILTKLQKKKTTSNSIYSIQFVVFSRSLNNNEKLRGKTKKPIFYTSTQYEIQYNIISANCRLNVKMS